MDLEPSAHLLWDVDAGAVDPERHARFLAPWVMDRGTLDHVRAVWDYYGPDRITR